MIDKIIESLESMAEDMRAMGDVEEASGVDSALWLIEEMTKQADTPQTDLSTEEFVEGMKNLKMEVKQTDCPFKDVPCSCGEQTDCPWKGDE